jgi:dTDP-glucose 4,6-dehydratase
MVSPRRFQRVLVTGGCGFIGSHLVRLLLAADRAVEIVDLDLLTYAGRVENLGDAASDPRHRLVQGDVADADAVARAAEGCDAVVNVAAETHVDRSIMGGDEFVQTNVLGTKRLLDWIVANPGTRFVQVSTDEVYGDVAVGIRSDEASPLRGSSLYAASKSAADLLVLAYARTYGIDASIVRGANAYGPYQYPEKLIPLFTINALLGRSLPLYGDGRQEREFTHVRDFASAIDVVLRAGVPGAAYNASAEQGQVNADTARRIIQLTGADPTLIRYVEDRPGHDRRYAISAARLRALGWRATVPFADGLAETVEWFRSNAAWWEPIIANRDYARYVDANYAERR